MTRSKPRTFNNSERIYHVKALILSSLLKWQNSALATSASQSLSETTEISAGSVNLKYNQY